MSPSPVMTPVCEMTSSNHRPQRRPAGQRSGCVVGCVAAAGDSRRRRLRSVLSLCPV